MLSTGALIETAVRMIPPTILVTRTLLLVRYLTAGDYSRAGAIVNGMFAR